METTSSAQHIDPETGDQVTEYFSPQLRWLITTVRKATSDQLHHLSLEWALNFGRTRSAWDFCHDAAFTAGLDQLELSARAATYVPGRATHTNAAIQYAILGLICEPLVGLGDLTEAHVTDMLAPFTAVFGPVPKF